MTAFNAKNRLGHLLDRVVAGEELIITRHGEPVAKLVPITALSDDRATSALKSFRAIRAALTASGVEVSRDEVRSWKSEGRR